MRFVIDRCIQCGVPRPEGANNRDYVRWWKEIFTYKNYTAYYNPSWYWFCSEICYTHAVTDLLEDRYQCGRSFSPFEKDPAYKSMKHKYWEKPNYYEERDKYFADWDGRRNEAYLAAQHKLCVCLKAEQLHEIKAIYEKNIEINQ